MQNALPESLQRGEIPSTSVLDRTQSDGQVVRGFRIHRLHLCRKVIFPQRVSWIGHSLMAKSSGASECTDWISAETWGSLNECPGLDTNSLMDKSSVASECTDWISAERRFPQRVSWIWHKQSDGQDVWGKTSTTIVLDRTLSNQCWDFSNTWALGNAESPFTAIAPRSNLAKIGNTWEGQIYGLVELNSVLMLYWVV